MCFILKRNNLTIGAFHATQVTADKVEAVGIFIRPEDKLIQGESYDLKICFNSGETQTASRMTRIQYLGNMHGEDRYAVTFTKTEQNRPPAETGYSRQAVKVERPYAPIGSIQTLHGYGVLNLG